MILVEPGAIATPIWGRSLASADALYGAMPPIAHERYGRLVAKVRAMAVRQGEEAIRPRRWRGSSPRHSRRLTRARAT